MTEIVVSVELPATQDFVPGSPLEVAGRVYEPLKGDSWDAAIGGFLVRFAAIGAHQTPNQRIREAIGYGIFRAGELLPKDKKPTMALELGKRLETIVPPIKA